MTLSIKKPRKEVVLSFTNKKILEAYHSALKRAFGGGDPSPMSIEAPQRNEGASAADLEGSLKDDTALVGEDDQARKEWWVPAAAAVNKGTRIITGYNVFNTKQYVLHPFEVELDGHAEAFFRTYEKYVVHELFQKHAPSLIKRMGDKVKSQSRSKLADQDEIGSGRGYILVQELFLRIAALALSNGFVETREGDKLVNAAAMFQAAILEDGLLGSGKQLSDFEKELATVHREKLKAVLSVVNVLDRLNANTKSISEAQRFIKDTELALKRNIVLFLNPKLSDASKIKAQVELDETFAACESKFLPGEDAALCVADKRVQIMACLEGQPGMEAAQLARLESLYRLLESAETMSALLNGIEQIQRIGGWIPILFGGLNMIEVAHQLSEYAAAFTQAVEITDPSDFRVRHPLGRGFVAIQTSGGLASTEGLVWSRISSQLTRLMEGEQRAFLQHITSESIKMILTTQQQLGICVIDGEQLLRLFPSLSKELAIDIQPRVLPPLRGAPGGQREPVVMALTDGSSAPRVAGSTQQVVRALSGPAAATAKPTTDEMLKRAQSLVRTEPDKGCNLLKGILQQPDLHQKQKVVSCYLLGHTIMMHHKDEAFQNSTGFAAEQGFNYLLENAKAGHPLSIELLAKAYEQGMGCQLDLQRAHDCYLRLKKVDPTRLEKAMVDRIEAGYKRVAEKLANHVTEQAAASAAGAPSAS